MTYSRQFLRLVVSGTLYQREGFSWGLSLISNGTGVGPAPTGISTGVRTAIETFHNATSSAPAKLSLIKLNLIGTNGRYVNPTTVLHDYGTSPISPTGGVLHAPQIALAVTLQSGVARGRAKAGRFYIPSPRFGLLDST